MVVLYIHTHCAANAVSLCNHSSFRYVSLQLQFCSVSKEVLSSLAGLPRCIALPKILRLHMVCTVASNWKIMEFWGLEWNLNSHDSSYHTSISFCNLASASFKTLASNVMFMVMNTNRLLQACLKSCKVSRTKTIRAAEEELDTKHTECHLLPQQPCLAECGMSWAAGGVW